MTEAVLFFVLAVMMGFCLGVHWQQLNTPKVDAQPYQPRMYVGTVLEWSDDHRTALKVLYVLPKDGRWIAEVFDPLNNTWCRRTDPL